jgi:hypothetical protein
METKERINGIIPILVLSIVIMACSKKSDSIEPSTKENGIFGMWTWIKTISQETGLVFTPESTGFTKLYRFTQDSVFTAWQNDSLIFQGSFSITRNSSFIITADSGDIIEINDGWFQDGNKWVLYWIHQDTLQLIGQCFDCSDQIFARIQN